MPNITKLPKIKIKPRHKSLTQCDQFNQIHEQMTDIYQNETSFVLRTVKPASELPCIQKYQYRPIQSVMTF